MKKLFQKSLALLTMLMLSVSMWGATNWSGWLGDGAGGGAYTNKYQIETGAGANPVNIQQPGTEYPGIYMTFPDAAFGEVRIGGAVAAYNPMGAAICLYLSNFTTDVETTVEVMNSGNTEARWTFKVWYSATSANPPAGESAEEPQEGINWSSVNWVTGSNNKYKIGAVGADNMPSVVSLQQPGFASKQGIYMTFPAADLKCTHEMAVQGAGICLYVDQFVAKETTVSVNYAGGRKTFVVYYEDGDESKNETPAEVLNYNFALYNNGAAATATSGTAKNAIDNDNGTRLETASSDPQEFIVDLGTLRLFNTVQIRWEGAYTKTFTLSVSKDGETYTEVKFVDRTLASPANFEESIDLGQDYVARFVKFVGTARGTGYGHSFYEFRVLKPGVSILTAYSATPAKKLCALNEQVNVTVSALDQNSQAMDVTTTYQVTPTTGSVTDGKFSASALGKYTVTASTTAGEVHKESSFDVYVVGDNLALNKAMKDPENVENYWGTFYNNAANRAVDGNDGTEWQGCATNETGAGSDARTYDAWFVVDLGTTYDIDLMTIHFEGACSDAYHIDFSTNATAWNTGYSFAQAMGVNNHTDYIDNFTNNIQVRYVRFWSTKASSQYGMKIFELKVFGRLNEADPMYNLTATVTPASTGSVVIKSGDDEVTKAVQGTTVTYTATAATNYAFSKWSDNNTDNPRTVVVGTEDVTLEAIFTRTAYGMTATSSKTEWGTAAVSATSVAINGTATFTATPTSDDYVFVNWTDAEGNEVSADATYTINNVAADYALTANFDYRRDVICHKAVLTNGGYKVYLTLAPAAVAGKYMVKVEGSGELQITGINLANTMANNADNGLVSGNDIPFTVENGAWSFDATGFGSVTGIFGVKEGKTIEEFFIWNLNLFLGTNHGEQQIPNFYINTYYRDHVDWNATCADETAPVLATPTAEALNSNDVRLTMSATDNWEGLITYVISREGAEDINLTNNASGKTVTHDVTGLATDAAYTFSVVAKDAAGNACVAKTCNVTLTAAGDEEAPTNVTVSAKALTDNIVELTLFANDNFDGDITYVISRDGAEDVSVSAARSTQTTTRIEGLTASTAYTFSVVAKDAANNAATAVSANVTTFSGNLALNKPAVAGGDALAVASGNNGNLGDRWASGGGDMAKNWWAVNLGDVYDVKNIRISFEGACPTAYTLQSSMDGENWSVIETYTTTPNNNANGALGWNEYPVSAQARWLKIVATAATFGNAYGISFWEFQAYGTPAVDNVKPVVATPVANGVSTTSVQVKATATDNFCGTLKYHFYLGTEEKGTVTKAYGEEASLVISGLTMGQTYTFGVKAEDEAGNISDMVTAQGAPVTDNDAPVFAANYPSVENVLAFTADVRVKATDNLEGNIYYTIKNGETELTTATTANNEEKVITVSGLNYQTAYTLTVVAADESGNHTEQSVNFTTKHAPYPLVAANAPAMNELIVLPVYSAKYGKTNCNWQLTTWGNNATRDNEEFGQKISFNASGYIGIDNFNYSLNDEDHIYMQIWSDVDNTINLYPIAHNEAETENLGEKHVQVTLTGGEWNYVDVQMADFGYAYLGHIYQIKIADAQNQILWLDNICFYRGETSVRTLTNSDMGTICLEKGAIPASGATFYETAYMIMGTNGLPYKIYFDEVEHLEPGHAYVFVPEDGASEIKLAYTFEAEAAAPVAVNGLHGTFEGINPTHAAGANELTGKYFISNNEVRLIGEGCWLNANRAYIDMSEVSGYATAPAPGRKRIALGGQGTQTPTALENVNATEGVQKMIINGQLFILRSGKMYNAAGQLVK